jgi:thymidylate synthase (FAD)
MRISILDNGYIEAVEHWGSDERIIEAARMSTDKGFQGWGPICKHCGGPAPTATLAVTVVCRKRAPEGTSPVSLDWPHEYVAGDEKLLRYLWENKHQTPFEMAGITIEVQAPIFVFREWHRHRVPFGYNELSARYTPMPNLNYVPAADRCFAGGGHLTKQAGTVAGAELLTEENANRWRALVAKFYDDAEELYQRGLGIGLPKELARVVVPVGRYSRMRATGNLRGWLGFLALRTHPTAQWEIRQFALALQTILAERFPRTLELFAEAR